MRVYLFFDDQKPHLKNAALGEASSFEWQVKMCIPRSLLLACGCYAVLFGSTGGPLIITDPDLAPKVVPVLVPNRVPDFGQDRVPTFEQKRVPLLVQLLNYFVANIDAPEMEEAG